MPLSDTGITRRTNGRDIAHPRGPIIAKRGVFVTAALTATERGHRHHSNRKQMPMPRLTHCAPGHPSTRRLRIHLLPNSRRSIPYNVNASAPFHLAQLTRTVYGPGGRRWRRTAGAGTI